MDTVLIENYKGLEIRETLEGTVVVYNPTQKTEFIVDLDDSKSVGYRTSSGMNRTGQIKAAKSYINWIKS